MGGPVVSDGMLMFVFQCSGLVPLVSGICVLVVDGVRDCAMRPIRPEKRLSVCVEDGQVWKHRTDLTRRKSAPRDTVVLGRDQMDILVYAPNTKGYKWLARRGIHSVGVVCIQRIDRNTMQ